MKALVLIADVVDSSLVEPADRSALQDRIRRLTSDGAAFRFTGGDEFEWRLEDRPESIDRVFALRAALGAGEASTPGVLLRCGVGRGPVWIERPGDPYAEDGPAFHRARAALAAVQRHSPGRRVPTRPFEPAGRTRPLTGWSDGWLVPERDAALLLMDTLMTRWSARQWQAIDLALRGMTYAEAGRLLGATLQSVQELLVAASFDLYLEGHAALKRGWEARPEAPA